MTWLKAMLEALEADGQKFRQLTGEDHGPFISPFYLTDKEWEGLTYGTHYLDADGRVKPKGQQSIS